MHVACAHWSPSSECHILNAIYREPVEISSLDPRRFALRCVLCRRRASGAPIQCSEPECVLAFHIQCARAVQKQHPACTLQWHLDYATRQAFCPKHRPIQSTHASDDIDIVGEEGEKPLHPHSSEDARKGGRLPLILIESTRTKSKAPSFYDCLPRALPAVALEWTCEEHAQVPAWIVAKISRYWVLKRRVRTGRGDSLGGPLLSSLASHLESRLLIPPPPPADVADEDVCSADAFSRELATRRYIHRDLLELQAILRLLFLREKKILAWCESLSESLFV